MGGKKSGFKDGLCVIDNQTFEPVACGFEEQISNNRADLTNKDDIIDDGLGYESIIFGHMEFK